MAGALTVRRVVAWLGWKVDTSDYDRFNKKTDEAKKGLEGVERQAGETKRSLVSMATDSLAKFDLVSNAIAKLLEPLKAVVATGARYESLRAALTTAEGGADKAAAAFARLQKFAAATPFQLDELTESYLLLKNQGLDPSERAMRAYGDTAAANGKHFKQMAEAVADAATGEFERLKEFGIKASSAGDKVSFSFKGVTTTVGKNAEEIQRYLISLGETNFAGGMERQSKTLEGLWSTLKDNIAAASDELFQAGLGDVLKEIVKDGIEGAKALGKWIIANKELIRLKLKEIFAGIRDAVAGLVSILGSDTAKGLVGVLGSVLSLLTQMPGGIATVVTGLGAMRLAVMASLGPWGLLAGAAIGALTAIVSYAADAERRTQSLGRSVSRMVKGGLYEQSLGGKSYDELQAMKRDIASEKRRGRTIREDVRGMSPAQIKRLEKERQLDLEATERRERALDEELGRRQASARELRDSVNQRTKEKAEDFEKSEERRYQMAADREELRYLKRKKRLSHEERARKMELEDVMRKEQKAIRKSGELDADDYGELVEIGDDLAKTKKPKKKKEKKTLMDLITGKGTGDGTGRAHGLGTTIINIDARNTIHVTVPPPTGLVDATGTQAAAIASRAGDDIGAAIEPWLDRQRREIKRVMEG